MELNIVVEQLVELSFVKKIELLSMTFLHCIVTPKIVARLNWDGRCRLPDMMIC